ncbi:hypothetical protein PGTUg99_024745 [Puccinia graminis f. sp. tritici]|uniref:Uncharacterized protein n=1 Tax=Puccinia graminis f. sp. tritici TaxID=56615 RepID=A0A5B0PLV0_PUCGR|nr:hypothetical protein PGTUg99_024745 [Puccinia graminis f. sp. tritici]
MYLTPHIPPLKPQSAHRSGPFCSDSHRHQLLLPFSTSSSFLKETQYKPTIAALNTHHTALYLSMPISTPQIRPKTGTIPFPFTDPPSSYNN